MKKKLKFFFNYIKENSNIITDGWRAYNFLDAEDVNYTHEIHLQGPNGNFGLGQHSTSLIEGIWSIIKYYIGKYIIISLVKILFCF